MLDCRPWLVSEIFGWLLLYFDSVAFAQNLRCAGRICLPHDYNQLERPDTEGTVDVEADLEVLQLLEVNDLKFTVSFSMYFNARWHEPRLVLRYNDSSNGTTEEPIDLEFMKNIWVPDVYFYHLKSVKSLEIFTKFAGLFANSVTPGFMVSQELHVTFWCPMRFETYPLDHQVCKFQLGSYAYIDKMMSFKHSRITYDESIKNAILDYSVDIVPLKEEDTVYIWHIGNFSLTGFELRMRRNKLKYLITQFLPSGMFVLVSFASFLIPPEVIPGRMTLLVTLFLVLINIFNSTTEDAPNSETLTAISAWVMVCILFVFGALGGYAGILFQLYKGKGRGAGSWSISSSKSKIQGSGPLMIPDQIQKVDSSHLKHIDNKLLVAFPLVFVIFNVTYWPVVLRQSISNSP